MGLAYAGAGGGRARRGADWRAGAGGGPVVTDVEGVEVWCAAGRGVAVWGRGRDTGLDQ